jgi:hypothetical protein
LALLRTSDFANRAATARAEDDIVFSTPRRIVIGIVIVLILTAFGVFLSIAVPY